MILVLNSEYHITYHFIIIIYFLYIYIVYYISDSWLVILLKLGKINTPNTRNVSLYLNEVIFYVNVYDFQKKSKFFILY